MLLAFCGIKACPAEVLIALRALDVSAATLELGNPDSTFRIRAPLCTLLHIDFIESGFD